MLLHVDYYVPPYFSCLVFFLSAVIAQLKNPHLSFVFLILEPSKGPGA